MTDFATAPPAQTQPADIRMRTADSEHDALEDLHELGCTDGLPVVIPTRERVERMMLASGLAADISLGAIGPFGGNATVETVAVSAVMAGCRPDYFPVVVAAVRAMCDPLLDMSEVQMTTHCLGPMVIVNGPARFDYGPFESGTGALGPGDRANASVGRAVRLCLLNIGGGKPGVGDMALFGQPAKFTFCLAEAEEESPFPPLHVRLGFDVGRSTVTLLNVEGPQSVICTITDDIDDTAERLLRQLAAGVGCPAGNSAAFGWGEVGVILNPEHASVLAKAGLTIPDIQQRVSQLTMKPRGSIHASAVDPYTDLDKPIGVAAENLLIVVAGGGGLYSMVMPSWGYGTHRNQHVTTEITDGGEACAVPISI